MQAERGERAISEGSGKASLMLRLERSEGVTRESEGRALQTENIKGKGLAVLKNLRLLEEQPGTHVPGMEELLRGR